MSKGDEDPVSREKIKELADEAEWIAIRPHLARSAVILVSARLDLLEAGYAIANDHSKQVQAWVDQALLSKPAATQIEKWDRMPAQVFRCLVLQPFVLIQELSVH